MANFRISSLRRSYLDGVDVSCSGFMEAASRRSLGFRSSHGQFHGRLATKGHVCVFLTFAALRINWAGVICARLVWSTCLEAVSTSAKRKFLNSRTPISCSVRPWCMWSCRNSLHVLHSVECLQVVRMVESHICTNRHRVHLERVHPLMNFGNYFRCRSTFAWIRCQMGCTSIQNNQESEGFVSNLCRPMISENEASKFLCSKSAHAKSAHARSFRSRFNGIAEWACLHHVLIEVIQIFRNIHVSRPLLELCGTRVIMLQMEVPQVALFRQFAYDVA